MDFEAAWAGLSINDYVAVSDGRAPPSIEGGRAWWIWRSHNFVGQLVEKVAGPRRKLRMRLVRKGHAEVTYEICETVPHTFELADADSYAND